MLSTIVTRKREELRERKKAVPLTALKERLANRRPPLDFARAISGERLRVIAELKRASPSRGVIVQNFDPIALANQYARGGAAAISVLTEENFFGGSLGYLAAVRETIKLPLLRKDFIFEPYQVYEAAAYGADALLLIAAILNQEQLGALLALSRELGLGALVEVHNEAEVGRALLAKAEVIGINNRDLRTFDIDLNTTRRLRALLPRQQLVVSESGIRGGDDAKRLRRWGVNAVLVGEALVTAADIPAKLKELMI